ncbi:MAG: diversity-generating retroelement protein Avd [Synechococcaceae cyanobacterium]
MPSDAPGSSSSAPATADLPIQEVTLELIRWFIPILHRLPRLHRHGLGDRLVANLYELLEQLALARFQRERLAILEPLRGRIQLIQLQTRLLHDFQLIDLRRYEHASRLIIAIGRQHSAWLSQQRQPA